MVNPQLLEMSLDYATTTKTRTDASVFRFACYNDSSLQAGIEFKKKLRVRFGKDGGLKLEYLWVAKTKKQRTSARR